MKPIVQLRAGNATARLLPAAGGRISALRLAPHGDAGVDVLYPYPEDFFDPIRWGKGGIYPLLPYSNRIANARVQVEGLPVVLAAHPDAAPHTLHGNGHAQPWTLVQSNEASAVMTLDSPASAAWPWRYSGHMRIELAQDRVTIEIGIRNTDTRIMPAGIGLHPYFRHRPAALVGYRATRFWPTTAEFLPEAPRPPTADEIYIPERHLPEGGLTHYVSGWDGTAQLDLPEGQRLRLHADSLFSHLVVHRPDNMAYLCLEPVSHVADAFNLAALGVVGTGSRLLAPGDSMAGVLRIQLEGVKP